MALTKRTYCLIALCHAALTSSYSQDDSLATKKLDEVIIRSHRSNGVVTRLADVNGVNIWTGKKNEVIQVADMDANIAEKTGRQIFARVPGVFVYDMDGSGNQVNISTRGLDPHRGWEFNIRKNGVITNSDMYGYPASHYSMPMEAVERIEIVRGTGSLQYGAQFGGMVNYVTRGADTTKAFTFENISTAGSFGLLSSYNAIGGKVGKLEYYAYYQKRVSDGYRDNAESSSDAQSVVLIYRPGSRLTLKTEFARSTYLFRIPGPLTDAMFKENPRQSTRNRNYFNPDIYVPSVSIDWQLNEHTKLAWTMSAVLGNRNSVQFDRPSGVADVIDPATDQFATRIVDIDNFNSYTSELKVLQEFTLGARTHVVTTGIQVFNNDLHRRNLGRGTTGSDFDLTVDSAFGRDLHFKTKNIALFLESSLRVTDKLSVNPGVRFETGYSDMSGMINYYDPGELPNTITHQFPLFGMNTEYKLTDNQNLYAGWSQSYRPVIFKDIIPSTTFERVDKDLKDAAGYTIEAGYRGNGSGFNWDIGAFQMQYNNRLGALAGRDNDDNFYLLRTNIGNSLTRGAEIYIERSFGKGKVEWSMFTSTAYFHARYTDASIRSGENNVDLRGKHVETTPSVITRNGFTLRINKAKVSLLYSYTAKSYADALNTEEPTSNGAVGVVPAYGLLDINASYAATDRLTFRFNINNATDKQYFTKRPGFYPGPGVWSSDGRGWSASVAIKI
jgi:Fe(3+) dicitrate transport protein